MSVTPGAERGTPYRAGVVTAASAWRLVDSVSLRPEPFGALAYDFRTRRLSFLKTPALVEVVRGLAESASDSRIPSSTTRHLHPRSSAAVLHVATPSSLDLSAGQAHLDSQVDDPTTEAEATTWMMDTGLAWYSSRDLTLTQDPQHAA